MPAFSLLSLLDYVLINLSEYIFHNTTARYYHDAHARQIFQQISASLILLHFMLHHEKQVEMTESADDNIII